MTVLDAVKAALVQQGWEVTRENIEGGTLVLEKDGERAVVGAHLYAIKDLPEDVVQRGRLLPAGQPGGIGFVIESEDGQWWDGEQYQDLLNDGAYVYGAKERINMPLPDGGKWVVLYQHETDGCFTTEACSGVNTCQDCLDVRKSCGEDVEALIAAQENNEQSEEDSDAQSE